MSQYQRVAAVDIETGKLPSQNKNDEFFEDGALDKTAMEFQKTVRLGFIRKVYGILSAQLLLTTVLCGLCMHVDVLREFLVQHRSIMWLSFIVSFVSLLALFVKKEEHPTNMYLLAGFTVAEATMLGIVCAVFASHGAGDLILQAAGLTLVVFASLTIYTMQSKADFSFLGAGLYSCLCVLMFWSLIQWLFGYGGHSALFSLFGAAVFSGYIIYDTWLITKKLSPDEYILGAINLYLDIVNLFLYILQLLSDDRN